MDALIRDKSMRALINNPPALKEALLTGKQSRFPFCDRTTLPPAVRDQNQSKTNHTRSSSSSAIGIHGFEC